MRILVLAPVLVMAACTNPLCGLLVGEHTGGYQGDATGDLAVSVTEAQSAEDAVDASFDLFDSAGGLLASGDGPVYCEDGQIVIDLRSPADDSVVGSVGGNMNEDGASGDWSMGSESGTWEYAAAVDDPAEVE